MSKRSLQIGSTNTETSTPPVKKQRQTTLASFIVKPQASPSIPTPITPKTEPQFTTHLADGGIVHFWSSFLTPQRATELFYSLHNDTNWMQSNIKTRGKTFKSPRMQSWMANEEVYGKADLYLKTKPTPWSQEMRDIKTEIEKNCQFEFDYVLMNLYRDGKDHISPHSDREATAASKCVIASLSLGATRRFVMQHAKNKDINKIEFALTPGSLLVMGGTTQKYWKHSVPKQLKVKEPRINLTFRKC